MMHFAHTVRMDVRQRRQHTTFTITEPSYFRLIVPAHQVDIDLELDSVDQDDVRHFVARSIGYEEVTFYFPLLLRFLIPLGNHLRTPCSWSLRSALPPPPKLPKAQIGRAHV